MNRYFLAALAPSTRRSYRSGLKSYKKFCQAVSVPYFPLVEQNLQLFVTSLAKRVSYATIKVYLCGVQYESLVLGFNSNISGMHKLYYVLRGVRRIQGPHWKKNKRLPITLSHLKTMLIFVYESSFCQHDKAMWACLILLAFFGLLRVSEYTSHTATSFDKDIHLLAGDISVSTCGTQASVRIKASKTDPFRAGVTIRLIAIGGPFCPVIALKNYLHIRGRDCGPFFFLKSGDFITRKFVKAFLSLTLPGVANINTHSFRIGGASAAAAGGVPDSVIKNTRAVV